MMTPTQKIKHDIKVIMEMAQHSKSMSIGAKAVIKTHGERILHNVETIEKENINVATNS